MFNLPIIFNTDSYKFSHYLGYPPGTTEVYSYAEARGGDYDKVVVMGMQAVVNLLLNFSINEQQIEQCYELSKAHRVPFNYEGWKRLFVKYAEPSNPEQHWNSECLLLKTLPIRIEGLRDGTVTTTQTPLFAVYNTDPEFPWLTSYLETALLRVWYPITVASRVFGMRQKIRYYFEKTSDEMFDGFGVLDFGSRGTTSTEASALGGLGHLASFVGSDNLPAIWLAREVYGSEMPAFSVAATEHSVMTAWGSENEFKSFEYILNNMAPEGGIISVVSDSWNIFNAVEKWIKLKDRIRKKNVKLVVRPDSGDIHDVLPKVLKRLEEGFGYTLNKKGYKVLNNVSVLWGDGIDEVSVGDPYAIAMAMGISADSIITGSGGGILQKDLNRDTMKFAFKASNVIVNGESIKVAKNPITDPGKMSKMGKFEFDYVYYDGGFVDDKITLDEIRENLNKELMNANI